MAIEIRILSGARAGVRERFEKSVVAIGRHPSSDLRFDPERDLDVSGRHAELRGRDERWVLHDVGSTNGTFVNGERVAMQRELADGDVISFGDQGPQAEVRLAVPAIEPEGAPRAVAPPPTVARPSAPSRETPARSTAERVAVAVREETKWLRKVLAIGAIALLAGVGGAYWLGHREAKAQLDEVLQLLALNESATTRLRDRVSRLGDTAFVSALARHNDSLRAIVKGGTSQARLAAVGAELRRSQVQQQGLALLDFSAISDRNDAAVAFIATELDGKAYGGTAFGVGANGLLVTNRHNVRSDSGHAATRIAVKFANTSAYLPAHVVRESPSDDIALLKMDRPGDYPVVAGVSAAMDEARVGSPVVVIGFPHSLDTPMEGDVVKTSLEGGTVSKRVTGLLQIASYAGHGSSGSPVFDSRGWVIGVVWGGAVESQGRIVYAVPGDRLAAFLQPDVAGIVK